MDKANKINNKWKWAVGAAALFIVLIAAAIFWFSSQNGSESSDLSTSVTRFICSVIFRRFDSMTSGQQSFIVYELNPFIRKLAHFGIYTLMGAALYTLSLTAFPKVIRRKRAVSLGASAVLASLDEIHQYFVPARSASIADVFIDLCGAAVGIIIVSVTVIIITHIKDKISGSHKN